MRLYEFKIVEQDQTAQLDQNIDKLAQIAKNNPSVADKINDFFKKLIDKAKQAMGDKSVGEVAPAQALDQSTFTLKQIADALCAELTPQACQSVINDLTQRSGNALDKLKSLIKTVALQYIKGWNEALADAIRNLSAKVTDTLEDLEAHYKKLKAEGDQGLKNVEAPPQDVVARNIDQLLRGMVESYKDEKIKGGQEEFEKFQKLIVNFLKDSKNGVVPLKTIVSVGSGNIIEEVKKTKYKSLVENGFIDELLSKMPPGTGGNWGPGELGLAILGSPVTKGKTGDIIIGKEKIEIKASSKGTQGGRLSADALVGEGTDGVPAYRSALTEFLDKSGLDDQIKIQGGKIPFTAKTKAGKVSQKKLDYRNFGKTFFKVVNNAIDALPNKKINKKITEQFLEKSVLAALKTDAHQEAKNRLNLAQSVDANGKIIANNFIAEWLQLLGYFYNKTKGVVKILIINPTDGHFEVFSTLQPKGLAGKLATGAIQTGAAVIPFGLSQQKPSPQIGTQEGGKKRNFD